MRGEGASVVLELLPSAASTLTPSTGACATAGGVFAGDFAFRGGGVGGTKLSPPMLLLLLPAFRGGGVGGIKVLPSTTLLLLPALPADRARKVVAAWALACAAHWWLSLSRTTNLRATDCDGSGVRERHRQ